MPVILKGVPEDNTIPASTMRDGSIGIIVSWGWGYNKTFNGRIVQRCGSFLFTIGQGKGAYWDNCVNLTSDCRVRLLKKGEMLEIEQ